MYYPKPQIVSVNYIHNPQTMNNCTSTFPDFIVTIISHSKSARTAIISPDWDFKKMGIGGLDKVLD